LHHSEPVFPNQVRPFSKAVEAFTVNVLFESAVEVQEKYDEAGTESFSYPAYLNCTRKTTTPFVSCQVCLERSVMTIRTHRHRREESRQKRRRPSRILPSRPSIPSEQLFVLLFQVILIETICEKDAGISLCQKLHFLFCDS